MRVTSVEIHSANPADVCVLNFRNPSRTNPYNVKSITGLDADEILNQSLKHRDLVMQIQLNPRPGENESYSSLRDDLYRMIAGSRTGSVQVRFLEDEEVVAALSGSITKFEAPHFEKTPEVKLTINSDDPMLRAITPVEIPIEGLDPLLTTIQDLLSTAPHGFKFEMVFVSAATSFLVKDPYDPSWEFEVTPIGGFQTNDVLHFSSEYKDKFLYVVRGAGTIHLADAIVPGSEWPLLYPGDNSFSVENSTSVVWVAASHLPTYWGV